MKEIGICALTGDECELRDSHIYPKFMFETMRKLGGTNFRVSNMPNKVLQDGLKRRLLGHKAEQMFSKSENWFAKVIFRPYCFKLQSVDKPIIYDESLYFFIMSVLWRVLYVYLKESENIDERFKDDLTGAEKEWRCYLLNKQLPIHYYKVYLLPLGNGSLSSNYPVIEGQEYYNLRAFDAALAFDDVGTKSAFYCKCPRFAFWGVLSDKHRENINYGLRIKPDGGKLSLKKWRLGEWYIIGFLYGRVYEANKQFKEGQSFLSTNQQNQILKNMKRKDDFRNSELADLLVKENVRE